MANDSPSSQNSGSGLYQELELLATGFTWCEGPLWLPAEQALIFSDIPGNRIMIWRPGQGADEYLAEVEFTNGRALAADGSVITCNHGRRAIERYLPGETTPRTLVNAWQGHRLNSPNDVVVDKSGVIWFTDPPYGIVQPNEGHPGIREYGDCWVFRFDPTTGGLDPVIMDVEEPNGLAFSPDYKTLYVADTSAALRPAGQGNRVIRAYDVVAGRWCKNGRVFAQMELGLADGFAVDVEGRLWTSHGPAISVIAPDGSWLETIAIPETVGNCCFGGAAGNELFIAASASIYRLVTTTRGTA